MQQKALATNGLDLDSADKFISQDDYRYALNLRNSINISKKFNAITNVRGNTIVPYTLPNGTNKCIGAYENKKDNSLIYMIWNSNLEHQILQYFLETNTIIKILKHPLLNFQKHDLINDIDLINNELLFWRDTTNQPRKVNIKKCKATRIKFNIYFALKGEVLFPNGAKFTLTFKLNGVTQNIVDFFGESGYENNLFGGVNTFVNDLNSTLFLLNGIFVPVNTIFKITTCGTHAEGEALIDGITEIDISSSTSTPVRLIYDNAYNETFIERYINAAKEPPHCEPTVEYGTDIDIKVNLLKNKTFQFATRYIYDDAEKSTISPFSIVPLSGESCATGQEKNNYIKVDFTDTKLNDKSELVLIKKIDIFVRESNIAKWKKVTTLERSDFGIGTNYYKFYNDGIYNEISDVEAVALFSNIPIIANAQEEVDNRIVYANNTEGYDAVCVDAKIDVAYKDAPVTPTEATYSISGEITIINPFVNNNDYAVNQPIHNTKNEGVAFGGYGVSDRVNQVGTSYKQNIPLSGFLPYLAGTDHYAISKQVINTSVQDGNGVYIITARKQRVEMKDQIEDNNVKSTFKISGVRNGKYILRFASHLTTLSELGDTARKYQRTSTNLWTINGEEGATECIVTVNGADVTIGLTQIADLTDPRLAGTVSRGITGYLTDPEILPSGSPATEPMTLVGLAAEKRIELARIKFDKDGTGYNGTFNTNPNMARWINDNVNGLANTDHNGYFFFARSVTVWASMTVDLVTVSSFDTTTNPPTLLNYEEPPSSFSGITSTGTALIIIRNKETDITKYAKTKVIFYVQDTNGNGIGGVQSVATGGDIQKSDSSGTIVMEVYSSTLDAGSRLVTFYFNLFDSNCGGTFSTSSYTPALIPIAPIGSSGGDYNALLEDDSIGTHKYLDEDFILTVTVFGISSNAFKRGFDGQFGIVYYDDVLRSTTTNTNEQLKTHINFYTEKLNGALLPSGTPELSWDVRNVPPAWATHWQWVRTLNTQTNFYVQLAAKKVQYVDDSVPHVVVPYNDASLIEISVDNLIDYAQLHPDSHVAYTFADGDRIRFILNNSGNLFNDYFDLPIKKADGYKLYIEKLFALGEIKEGVAFEIYTPKLKVSNEIFYEFGECFEVGETNGKKYHKGLAQDQDPDNPFGTPAKGIFRTGDAYYRKRRLKTDNGTSVGSVNINVDDASISDFYSSKVQSIGRTNVENKDVKQLLMTNKIVLSDKYIPSTSVNGLSMFQALNFVETERQFGGITKLVLADDNILLVLHENKVQPFYVGRATIRDAKNLKLLALADDILNGSQWLQGDLGCQNPESVEEHESKVRFYDNFHGVEVRYSNNGLIVISNNKAKSYFKDKSDAYKNLNIKPKVIAVFDNYYEQRLITFNDADGLVTPETISFSEPKNRYESFYSFLPEMYGKIGNQVIAFKDGALWLQDTNSIRNNFFGVQYGSKLRKVFNRFSEMVNTFLNMTLRGNKAWECDPIIIPPSDNNPIGMQSRIKAANFKSKEGVWYADFKKDLNTPNTTDPIVNGRQLKGELIDITMTNNDLDEIELYTIDAYSTKSERSNK